MMRFVSLMMLLLAACSPSQVQQASYYQQQISNTCATVLPLAGLVPSVGVYAVAACATEQGIAKLALDPTSLLWLADLKVKLQK